MCSSLVLLNTYNVDRLMHVKSIEAQISPIGVVLKMPAQVSLSSLEYGYGLKLRGLSPVALKAHSHQGVQTSSV
ncbi:hypothetical protein TNCV_1621471 [Trichonephila clavipes]|nr:hypothetical protein TNCV_1621471 [Trichonephila clavipes]